LNQNRPAININKYKTWSSLKLAAQCVFPRLNIDDYYQSEEYSKEIDHLVHLGVGGFCVFGGNTITATQLISKLQSLAEVPMLFCADFEFGLPMRLEDGTAFPQAMAVGKANDLLLTRKIARSIAKEAKEIGVHWNLAPVCDINSNPKNPIINVRAFGEDAKTVALHTAEFIKGTAEEKVLSSAKHFPGHGAPDTDSHLQLPVLNLSEDELFTNELLPFINAIEENVSSVMIGHLFVPQLDAEYPASLSHFIINDLLRSKLGFYGLILTDALDMYSITDNYSSSEAALLSILAGADIALLPKSPLKAINAIEEKIKEDANFKIKVSESVYRIERAKRFCELIPGFAKMDAKPSTHTEHLQTALKAAYKAIDVNCSEGILPINEDKQFAAFAFLSREEDLQAASRFFTMLAQATENDCDMGYFDNTINDDDIENYKSNITDAAYLVFAVFVRSRAYTASIEINGQINEVVEKLSDGRQNIVVLFGSPYIDISFAGKNIIYAYSDSFPSLAAAIMKLTGRKLVE